MARLGDIMSGKVLSVEPTAPLAEAAQAMMRSRVGSAVVIDGPWLVGIFTERDALRAVASGQDLTQASIRDWMTKDPITVSPEMDTEEAAEIMAAQGFRHLPVADEDKVLGVVSQRDLLATRVRRRTT